MIPIAALQRIHTLIIGSGAAGLNAAVQLARLGIADLAILTEGLHMGTSINTGSDKQTYYKLSLCGEQADSPDEMARTLFEGGAMHGDLALVEAGGSAQAFLNLVNLGVPFPRDAFGQFPGYKTDHDPRQRAASIGPYTSQEMCRCLLKEALRLGVRIEQGLQVIELVTAGEGPVRRVVGVLALDRHGAILPLQAENVVFAVGGPGGLYKSSVYPEQQTGAIGVALRAGARAANLPESQFGLASTAYRWNVSGTYMQVIPRIFSAAGDGVSDPREFLRPYFAKDSALHGNIFLKGYQWPFDAARLNGGSSLIDLLVYIETEIKGRRVYLDFRDNPADFAFENLPVETRQYLERSQALQFTPIERLEWMNPQAVRLYQEHGIDLHQEPLEVAVCAQHNNGGLAANIWFESTNIRHLFPIGEVNGSHGVRRPGGASLNAGQVGGLRAAQFIANRCADWSPDREQSGLLLERAAGRAAVWAGQAEQASATCAEELAALRSRMTLAGGHIRHLDRLIHARLQAWEQVERLETNGCRFEPGAVGQAFTVRQLSLAHALYLDAIWFALQAGVGSRGSYVALDPHGQVIHPDLGEEWRMQAENETYRRFVLESQVDLTGRASHRWTPCRPLPATDAWFETSWRAFQNGEIYQAGQSNE